ncbi:MAG: dienelactone hydrolase family protein [Candidatus Binatia bacterium]
MIATNDAVRTVSAGTIDVETPDGVMALYEARPDGRARGAVVVVQEAIGVDDHLKDVVRRFAAEAYHAVAPDLYHRLGGGTMPYDDRSRAKEMLKSLTDETMLVDVEVAREHHGSRWSDEKVGIVGFCMGGRVAFLAALRRPFGASVTFYGGGIITQRNPLWPPLVGEAAALRAPWLGLFGDRDEVIPVEDVERLREATRAASVATEVVRYPDAGHGFHCDERPDYHEPSAKDAWRRMLDWFGRHLGQS